MWLSSVNFFPCEIVQSHVYHHTSPQQKENNKLQTCRLYSTSSDKDTEHVYKGLIKDDSSFLFMNHGIFPGYCFHRTPHCLQVFQAFLLHTDDSYTLTTCRPTCLDRWDKQPHLTHSDSCVSEKCVCPRLQQTMT